MKNARKKSILAAMDTTGSYGLFFETALKECASIGEALGSAPQVAWIDESKPLGAARAKAALGSLDVLQEAGHGCMFGGGFHMVDVLKAARLARPVPPDLLIVASDFADPRPDEKSFDAEFLGWASQVGHIAVLGVPNGADDAREWARAASVQLGSDVQAWQPGAAVAWAEADALRSALGKRKVKASAVSKPL